MGPSKQKVEAREQQENRRASGVLILGVPVRLHFTFILLLLFLLATGVRGGQPAWMNAAYIIALFASVLLHELGHVGVARRYGIRTSEIVLYPIGGVARLERSPRPHEELWIALAGPLVNVLIAAALSAALLPMGLRAAFATVTDPADAHLLARIAVGNIILAAFNMIPAFPMDGGRVLRALMARWTTEELATRRAAKAGQVFAILIGLYGLVSMQFMLLFIAFFVYLGATQETAVVTGKVLTEGVTVRESMVTLFETLQHGSTIRDAASLLLATSQQDFPVMHGGTVVGLLARNALLRGMAVDGPEAYVAGVMDRNFPKLTPDSSLEEALPLMAQTSCALVMDAEGRLVGLLTRENVSEFLMLRKVGLGQPVPAPRAS
ncbi:MAG TPA: site-2 protease family protein [Bryobacteraceae bacterium]|nr:site-2 protease family protein [Bryobacteraceae bacterium]